MLAVLSYNALMLVADAAAVFQVWRFRNAVGLLAAAMFVGILGVVAALAVGIEMLGSFFGVLALISHAVFGHVLLVLVASAYLLRRDARRLAIACAVAAVAIVLVGVDAFLIEPTWLEVNRYRIESPKLRAPLRIAVLADLQSDSIGAYERSVLERVMAEKPDMILLAGDYLQIDDPHEWLIQRDRLRALLAEVKFAAPLGVYAVAGNVDRANWTEIFAGSSVESLAITRSIDLQRDDLRVTGLSMVDSFEPTLNIAESDRFHICLGHSPDFALGSVQADLLVAGHTHGGQVRLPFFGPLVTFSRVPRHWATGLNDLGGGRRLLVSRGVGMERGHAPRLRFLCRPELVFLELSPAGE
ncbi:MAG: metallophosphoesterase [Pirellulales bacterium]